LSIAAHSRILIDGALREIIDLKRARRSASTNVDE